MTAANDDAEAAHYSMRVVTRMTGLTADTVRAWERRHSAVTPVRTAGNTRRYTNEDVRRLVLLKSATDRGHAIGAIATLDDEHLRALAPEHEERVGDPLAGAYESLCTDYIEAIKRFDARAGMDLLHRSATLLPPREFVFELVMPILAAVGKAWEDGRIGVAQEHMVSAQLTGLLGALNRLRATDPGAKRVLFTAPQGHRHGFGIQCGALLVALRGIEAIDLGVDLPHEEVIWAAGMSRADLLVMAVARDCEPDELPVLASTLELLARRMPVWLGCPAGHELRTAAPSVRFFDRLEDFDVALIDFAQ